MENCKLPKEIWSYFMSALNYSIAYKYKCNVTLDNAIWTMIPAEERIWCDIKELESTFFPKKKNMISLDFNIDIPILGDGDFFIKQINEAISHPLSVYDRNIYIFDNKFSILILYIEGHGILLPKESYGKLQSKTNYVLP